MLQKIGDVLLVLSALPANLCVLVFARVDWRKSPLGRHMMAYMAVFAAVLDLGCVRLCIGFVPLFEALRVCVFALVPFVLWWRVKVLVEAQARGEGFNQPTTTGVPGPPAGRPAPTTPSTD